MDTGRWTARRFQSTDNDASRPPLPPTASQCRSASLVTSRATAKQSVQTKSSITCLAPLQPLARTKAAQCTQNHPIRTTNLRRRSPHPTLRPTARHCCHKRTARCNRPHRIYSSIINNSTNQRKDTHCSQRKGRFKTRKRSTLGCRCPPRHRRALMLLPPMLLPPLPPPPHLNSSNKFDFQVI